MVVFKISQKTKYSLSVIWIGLATLTTFCLGVYNPNKKPPHPHIIVVTLRDMGWDDVSFHGNPEIPTPNIDRIANHGVILQQYYTTPNCEDSVSSYRTGKHPIHYKKSMESGENARVTYDIWNYLDIQSYVIREVGLIDCKDTDIPFYPWDVIQKAENVLKQQDQIYSLFLQVNFPQLHADYPEQIPDEYLTRAKNIPFEARKIYAGMIMQLDRAVGHLVRILYDTGILHDAILIFTTLTGGTKGNNFYTWPSTYPFRGGNGTLWEGGSRALGFVYSNRIARRGRVSYGLVHINDWLPTIFRLAGGNPDHVVESDGMDVWDSINNDDYSPRMEILYGINGNKAAVRVGDFKLITGESYVPLSPRPLAKGELDNLIKPITVWDSELECADYPDAIGCWPDIEPCLFNVRFDPCERNNVAYYMPQTVEALTYTLNKYNTSAVYRDKRSLEEWDNTYKDLSLKLTLIKLEKSRKTLDRSKIGV
ncbi:arylsulfatase I [Hydra vulgaris]|uniref:Arylsulfatase I n=1 Tax=Hydra vulgaris TaxID=6087 RepID=A0ABM4BE89_HYDVU